MNRIFYGLKTCDTCRKARRWLDARDVAYGYHDVRDDGLDAATLRALVALVGWEPLVNRRSTTWRSLDAADRDNLDEARAVALLARHPTLMKRPVLVAGDRAVVGFHTDTWQDLVS